MPPLTWSCTVLKIAKLDQHQIQKIRMADETTVPLPTPKPVVLELRDPLVPDFDQEASLAVLSDPLPFLFFVVVIAIVIHLTRKLVTRRRSISESVPGPVQSRPRESPVDHSTCRPCLAQPESAETDDSSAEPTGVDQSPQDDWHRLCSYARRCVQAEAAQSLVTFEAKARSWFCHTGSEQLIVGHTDTVRAPAQLATSLASSSESPQKASLLYGWPTLVFKDDRRLCVAPLFYVQIEADRNADGEWRLQAATEPEFNQAIVGSGAFEDSITQQVGDLLGTGWPFGDQDACANCATKVAELIGLAIHAPLEPAALSDHIQSREGVYNAAISAYASATSYYTSLIKELEKLKGCDDWMSSAAAHLIRAAPKAVVGAASPSTPLAAPLLCNQSQEHALQRIRAHPLTIVTGPPGTGKTELVVNAVCNAWLDGEKVLVTSTNNAAVDVAVDRAVERVFSGLLIRTGNRKAREDVLGRISDARCAATPIVARPPSSSDALSKIAGQRAGLFADLERLNAAEGELLALAHKLETVQDQLNNVARRVWHLEAPPVARRDPRRIEDRADRLLNARFLRRFRSRRLRKNIRCLHSAPISAIHTWARLEQERSSLTREIEELKQTCARIENSVGDVTTAVPALNQKWAEISYNAVRQHVAMKFDSQSSELARFSRTAASAKALRGMIASTLGTIQGWACTALSTGSNFPRESGLFDLVILDEASQCTLAAVLPLAYRAKRLAVIGDPSQLQPIVRVGDNVLKKIAEETGFDNDGLRDRNLHHKDASAYLAFAYCAGNSNPPVLLDEHYRCHPQIARWFNRTFYNDELTVLTEVEDADHSILWKDVAGECERGDNGESWCNPAEAEEVVRHLTHLVRSDLTVGVVTPFRGQADRIKRLARARISRDALCEAGFLSATAHSYQGNERDAIVISCVVSPDMSHRNRLWIEDTKNLINVAVSRARRSLIVIGHPEIDQLGIPTLGSLRAYLRNEVAAKQQTPSAISNFRVDSRAEQLVFDGMRDSGLKPYAKLNVAGYELDFALLDEGIKLNVEIDGDHHIDVRGKLRRQDIGRDRILRQRGWEVLRVSAWRCHDDLGPVLEDIRTARDRLLGR